MNVIMLEEEAFYQLVKKVVERIKEEQGITEDRWITGYEAMRRLGIKSKTSLQKLRDEGKIRFTQPQQKIILYDAFSINNYLEKHAQKIF